MTVVAAVIARACTVHATDSFLTVLKPDGSRRVVESQETKIVAVPAWRGALAYWGLAGISSRWKTLDWLRSQASNAGRHGTAEHFAEDLARNLEAELLRLGVARSLGGGIGIHLTVYERLGNYWIPELFLISNYLDPTYSSIQPSGVLWSRETYGTITGEDRRPSHGLQEVRQRVQQFLGAGGWLQYNNGDPALFNAPSGALHEAIQESNRRGLLGGMGTDRIRGLARLPVETIVEIQRTFYRSGRRIVGGRVHDLTVTPEGVYTSTSGDAP